MRVKIYSVEFIQHTNYMQDTVCNKETKEYLHLPEHAPLLVPEFQLDMYSGYGGGFKSINLVGYMDIDERRDYFDDSEGAE
jgi:hypothetical protein